MKHLLSEICSGNMLNFLINIKLTLLKCLTDLMILNIRRKLEYISTLSKRGTVISEVGSKKKDVVYSPDEWVAMMKAELDAGSVKVIAEARESGTTGIYNEDGSINNKIIRCNI